MTFRDDKPRLSIIICVYNMRREAPRTILSALPPYQKNVNGSEYEVIVVDNGSTQPLEASSLETLPGTVRYVQYPGRSPSPVFALNWAAQQVARGSHIAFCIDGTRILSDGLVAAWLKHFDIGSQVFVYTLGWHIGPNMHQFASQTGYNQDAEDRLLESVDWRHHPEALFEISTLAGSSQAGFFAAIAESNAFAASRALLDKLGLYDERFTSPGGGLANLEIFSRYVTSEDVHPICLLGEGSFHQYHDGIATSGKVQWETLAKEYETIIKKPYEVPTYTTLYSGPFRREAHKFYAESLQKALHR